MKQAYVIEAGRVVNTIVLSEEADPAVFEATLGPDGVEVGWSFDGTSWSPPAPAVEPPSLAELIETAKRLVEAHINEAARTRRYTDAVSCASYVASTNATWAAEATAFVAWRDSVWAQVYALEDKAQAGEIATLPTADDLIAGLPAIAWPD